MVKSVPSHSTNQLRPVCQESEDGCGPVTTSSAKRARCGDSAAEQRAAAREPKPHAPGGSTPTPTLENMLICVLSLPLLCTSRPDAQRAETRRDVQRRRRAHMSKNAPLRLAEWMVLVGNCSPTPPWAGEANPLPQPVSFGFAFLRRSKNIYLLYVFYIAVATALHGTFSIHHNIRTSQLCISSFPLSRV